MTFALGLLLIAGTVAFVAWPLFRSESEENGTPLSADADDEPSKWEKQKADSYGAIKEAEFDYRMGKLNDADFELLRARYTGKALEAIAELERESAVGEAAPPAARSPSGKRPRGQAINFCPSCGASISAKANFCPACGRSLAELSAVA